MRLEEALNVLDFVLAQACLSDTQESVFCEAWAGKTYSEIATELNFAVDYIKAVGAELWQMLTEAFGERVSKTNFRSVIERWARQNLGMPGKAALPQLPKHQDWGEAVDVSTFFGRTAELGILEQWIVRDRCRLVAILGMGGIGKTALSVKFGRQVQPAFDWVIWRSLRHAPPLHELLGSLLQFLANGDSKAFAMDISGQLSQLLDYLKHHRCLIILDNAEAILQSGEMVNQKGNYYAGNYREGYENYGEFLRCIGEVSHQSCLVLTSREEPKEIDILKGDAQPVRSLQLIGLTTIAGQEIFRIRGEFSASESEWNDLVQHYAGNPLALKMVASVIKDLFDSKVAKFLELLEQGALVFDDIRDILRRQFERLADDEKEVMFWLAIMQEPIPLTHLQEQILSSGLKRRLPEILKSLGRRSMIERQSHGFTQQPVVMEYLIEQFVEQVCEEISADKIQLLMSHALMQAQAKSYVRESQMRLILQAIADRLCERFQTKNSVELKLQQILLKLQTEFAHVNGYAAGNLINLCSQLKLDLSGYDFSHLVIWQAYLPGMRLHNVNFAACDLAKSVFTETLSSIWAVALSADGNLLAASDTMENICLWQVADGKKRFTFRGHPTWATVAFNPNGQVLATAGGETIKLWDTTTGQCLQTLNGHQNWLLAICFSNDGQRLASSSADGTIRIWDSRTGQCLQTFSGHTDWIRAVAFVPTGISDASDELLLSGSADDTVKLWQTVTGECLQTIRTDSGGIWAIAPSPTGQTLVTGGADATLKLWHLPTGNLQHTLYGHTGGVKSLAFSGDGCRIVSSGDDQTIRLWDGQTGDCLKVLQGHTSGVWSIACAHHLLASGGLDQQVKLWDVRTGKCLSTLQGYTDFVLALAVSPGANNVEGGQYGNGSRTPSQPLLAVGSADHTIQLWDIGTGKVHRILQGHTNWVLSVAFSPDYQTLASGGFDQTIRLWDVHSGSCLRILKGHSHWVSSVHLSAVAAILISCSFDRTIRLWDIHTGECLQILEGHEGRLFSSALRSDGQLLASGGDDRGIRLWDLETGTCIQTLVGHDKRVWSVAFSPDGTVLASGSGDRAIRLWDVGTGECLRVLQGHLNRVQSVTFSPDGKLLATGSEDRTVKLWDLETGACLHTLQGHTNRIWSVKFGHLPISPDTPVLISGGEDGTIRLWDTVGGECIKTLSNPRPYQNMNITGITGLTAAQKATLKVLGACETDTSTHAGKAA